MTKTEKSEFKTQIHMKRAAVDALRVDYLETLNTEVKRVGGTDKLAKLLGRSGSYIRMARRRSLLTIKDCVEEIAVKLYGWDGK